MSRIIIGSAKGKELLEASFSCSKSDADPH